MQAIIHPRVRDFGVVRERSLYLIIYKAINTVNNKIYIGQTTNTLEYRKNQHIREAKSKRRKSVYFHNAILKYGHEQFIFEEIDSASNIDELNTKERYWIAHYQSNNKRYGYNLDSGGNSGGCKSEETKRKIGETTKEKWNDPEIAQKMLDGLKKGTETIKKNKKTYPFICPVCKNTFYYPKHIAEKRKFCSQNCSIKGNDWMKGVKSAAFKTHMQNIERKMQIKRFIIHWVKVHPNIIKHCPYNKITPTLQELINQLNIHYHIKDLRSIFICFEVHNKKQLLDRLKEYT